MSLTAQLSADYRFSPAPTLPRLCTSILNRVSDRYWENHFNIQTAGDAPSPHPDAHRYGYLAYHTSFSVFDHLQLKRSDVVVDLGCGKGRVSCLAASYPIKASVGIEIDPSLCAHAQINAARMRHRRAPLSVLCKSAVNFDYDDVTIVVMFHPFGAETLRAVLDQWQRSLARNPRRFRIVYENPLFSPILAAKRWLKLQECWVPGMWSRIKFPVHFYESVQT